MDFLPEDEQKIIKQKISKANKGKKISNEQRRQVSNKLKGRPSKRKGTKASDETKQKQSLSHKEAYKNIELHKKIGLAVHNSKKYQDSRKDPNFRKKMSEINKGRKCSEETKQKIREKHLGKKMPEEYCKQLSKRMKGTKFSEKHKQKIAESLKGKSKEYLENTHWYNNGKECLRAKECPEGFIPGRLKKN